MTSVAHRVALVTLAATFVLILFGGLVTNTGAALAVPDWPSTFGSRSGAPAGGSGGSAWPPSWAS
ncbi:MAG: hypothetical protein AUH99_03065 [Candidatus Rokubacteria bacterium 13_2_20CM_2_70_11]|nr:MAG: hypothetical protein AUH99_03065 [Candidatus Rokubacteria bacterium 13_2_20CM_2_70_11]